MPLRQPIRAWWLVALLALWVLLAGQTPGASAWGRGQKYSDFTTPIPLAEGETLILGFVGGRDRWNNPERAVRRLALKLRSMGLPRVYAETVENTKRDLAVRLVRDAFDRDRDGRLDAQERASARLIVYGQSFGGAAVVKFSRQLDELGLPVLLTVQVDSVGLGDRVIPPNVARAANLFQRNGWVIRGEKEIRAEDPSRTVIVGNFEYDYRDKKIDISKVSWFKKVFRFAHTKMEHDPEVWTRVEDLILEALNRTWKA